MNICKLRVKANFTGEALIVPRYWEKNGVKLPVAQIGLYQETGEYCTTLKRMYFESGSEIQVLRGPFWMLAPMDHCVRILSIQNFQN